ncbi:MAG: bfmBAB [Actinomycetia bacterium]|nr:bfmBAB [Actinomycetes bacterium]
MTTVDDTRARLPGDYDVDEVLADLRLACVARAIDERELTLQKQNKVFFEISGAGHEALGLGLARSLRPAHDWFFPYYRDLALVLGLGVTPEAVLLQAVGSADDPSSGGRQMPSHWGDAARHIVTQSSPTGSQVPGATGCAEASRYLADHPGLAGCSFHEGEITYVSLGEGACSEGEVWESLSAACTLGLPLLIVVADNGWAISVPARDQAPAPIDQLVTGFPGLQIYDLNGADYFAVRRVGERATAWVRGGNGPALIHAKVPRPLSHSSQDSQAKYRAAEELAEEALNDPIRLLADALVGAGVLSIDDIAAIRAEASAEVAAAARRALAARRPDPVTVADDVVVVTPMTETVPATAGEPVTMVDAINRTLHDLMAGDERIRVFGQDVADARPDLLDRIEGKGGVFGLTRGLQRAFGADRCTNAPIAEANIVGRAVGQAVRGLRPCPEIQFFDYIWPAMQQIKSEAATIRWRSNGTYTVPLVLRVPIGGYVAGGSIWHSQCGESIFAHVPGLLIAFPSRAADAAGLLRAAVANEDPVQFLEHKHLFRQPYARDPYPGADHVVPFGKGVVRRPGTDVTVVTWGATVEKSLQAAARLDEAGVSLEVLDLRTIVPWDQELVAASVARTRRLLVVHEDTLTCGFGAEIAAWAADELFDRLVAPIRRVAALDTPVPYEPTLAQVVLPQVEDIAAAAAGLVRR